MTDNTLQAVLHGLGYDFMVHDDTVLIAGSHNIPLLLERLIHDAPTKQNLTNIHRNDELHVRVEIHRGPAGWVPDATVSKVSGNTPDGTSEIDDLNDLETQVNLDMDHFQQQYLPQEAAA